MKRVLAVILCIVLCTGCADATEKEVRKDDEMIGLWITYSEIAAISQDERGFEEAFGEVAEMAQSVGVNTLFVHARAFCDAAYISSIFPTASYVEEGVDALGIMVEAAHRRGMKIHAWINPYRVASSGGVEALPQNSPAKIWLTDEKNENDTNVCVVGNGIYLNPAAREVKELILAGVREIIENYDVDGIHIDDYFYPTTDASFDEKLYGEYAANTNEALPLEHWRIRQVSSLVKAIYCAVKAKSGDLLFGVSPAADLEQNYNELYADVEGWIGGGYIDYIIPQLYFGFEYPDEKFRFDNLLIKWLDLTEGKGVPLYVGLAAYKAGTEQSPDADEWGHNADVIARQIDLIRKEGVKGFAFFSYSSLFSENEFNKQQYDFIMQRMN